MPRLYNLSSHKLLRQQLRRTATSAERKLWRYVKNDQLHGYRFRRQFGIGRYIVDFYCPKLRLAVEINGQIHQEPVTKVNDEIRQKFLESCFIRVVRFTNSQVMDGIEAVMKTLGKLVTSPYVPLLNSEGGYGGAEGEVIEVTNTNYAPPPSPFPPRPPATPPWSRRGFRTACGKEVVSGGG